MINKIRWIRCMKWSSKASLQTAQSTRGPNHQNQRQHRVLMNRTRYSKWLDQKQNFIDLKLDWHNSNCCCCCIRLHTLLTPENREYRFVFLGSKHTKYKKMSWWQKCSKQTNKQTNLNLHTCSCGWHKSRWREWRLQGGQGLAQDCKKKSAFNAVDNFLH